MNNEAITYLEAGYTQKITVFFAYAAVGKTFCGPIAGYQGTGPGLAADPLPTNDGGNLTCAALPSAGGAVGGVVGWDVPISSRGPVIRGAGTFVPVTVGTGGVTAGDLLMVDAAGLVKTATSTNVIVGRAHLTAIAGADTVVELFDGNQVKD